MVTLNENQVELICEHLFRNPLQDTDLQDSLLDHFCCFVESKMSEGFSFEESIKEASVSIAPNGVGEIEEELFFIIHFKTQITMKRILYFSSFLVAFSLSFSFLFKALHWPYANILLQLGNIILLFFALPSLVILAFKNKNSLETMDKIRLSIGILAGGLISTGMIFKGLHFPYASILFVVGCAVFSCLFLPIFFYQLYQKSVRLA
ncbi:hypothetical protein WAF17_00885 [Bernardetia sp. ABR2-2B]|uniref:hypothetical protein n=1 Tax=Bernardetia sp. ABR2-2B TaxID=3127472 RepID=UPI0030D49707